MMVRSLETSSVSLQGEDIVELYITDYISLLCLLRLCPIGTTVRGHESCFRTVEVQRSLNIHRGVRINYLIYYGHFSSYSFFIEAAMVRTFSMLMYMKGLMSEISDKVSFSRGDHHLHLCSHDASVIKCLV